ncbi:MAG: BREX system P-loop protein BrxC, partial [Deltaproteobacteria bacterium]|nr:BREX system P-loop protein BrxC [Deltaproteobacteria bacterium]
MKNREIYVKDPDQNLLLNNGVATVTDERSIEEFRTLRYELETFVCEGEYARGLKHILETYLANLDRPEQPGVWVSGFFGSGKSHFIKMLRALLTDFVFPQDGATARGLTRLPAEVADPLKELSTQGKRMGDLHAASGTLGAGAGDNVRMALLAMVFKSVDLPEQYPLARFVIWLRDNGFLEPMKAAISQAGRNWDTELRNLYVSPYIAQALLTVYPDFAPNAQEVHALLKNQYPNVEDISNKEMVDVMQDALEREGRLPLTLIALDEVQQYIGENTDRAYKIQELTEACCKKFAGRLLFVATGQTALTGTPLLQKLQGRFPVPIELSDTDVETVIRRVILAKKPDRIAPINQIMTEHLGEISRHLMGTKLEHRSDDSASFVLDYPLLPVRRRFWERILRSIDQAGTTGQLRNQLNVVHEAARKTADLALGNVV